MAKRSWSVREESRVFNEAWEEQFFVILNSDKKSTHCLICDRTIAGLKKSNVERHFTTLHSNFCSGLPIDSAARQAKLSQLKKIVKKASVSSKTITRIMICCRRRASESVRLFASIRSPSRMVIILKKLHQL